MDDIEEFKDWLRKNTTLLDSSINLYARTVKYFFSLYDKVTLDNCNSFISESFREKRSYYTRYAILKYLDYINKKDLARELVKVKYKPRKKMSKYYPKHIVQAIIDNIENEFYKDIATIQYATAARAREIILLKEHLIDFDYKPDRIKIRLEGKGAKEGVTFLDKQYEPILKKYLKGKVGFLFLKESYNQADSQEIEKIANNIRTYYYIQLKKAAIKAGLVSFGTHDFRRNVAQSIIEKTKDIYKVKKILRHSSIQTTATYLNEMDTEEAEATILEHQR